MAIVPLGGGDVLVTADPVGEEAGHSGETLPDAPETLPAEEAAFEALASEVSLVTIALTDVVWEWIEESLETAPPVSQLHFSLHLRACLDALEEKFRALA